MNTSWLRFEPLGGAGSFCVSDGDRSNNESGLLVPRHLSPGTRCLPWAVSKLRVILQDLQAYISVGTSYHGELRSCSDGGSLIDRLISSVGNAIERRVSGGHGGQGLCRHCFRLASWESGVNNSYKL